VHNGTCTITASITGNPESDTCTITVKASPAANLDVVFTPNLNYVLEGDSTKYGVYKFTNGATGSEAFTFTLSPHTIPPTSYKFTQNDSHHFTIENKLRDVDSYLTVNYGATGVTGTFDIYLRGAWLNDSI
jgi:hypothetical protein